jgi:hypothetical protein
MINKASTKVLLLPSKNNFMGDVNLVNNIGGSGSEAPSNDSNKKRKGNATNRSADPAAAVDQPRPPQ